MKVGLRIAIRLDLAVFRGLLAAFGGKSPTSCKNLCSKVGSTFTLRKFWMTTPRPTDILFSEGLGGGTALAGGNGHVLAGHGLGRHRIGRRGRPRWRSAGGHAARA
jgi:hypothetical protein